MDTYVKSDLQTTYESTTSQLDAIDTNSNILIAYFSRWGNTKYSDDVDASTSASIVIDVDTFGTTEYIAHMIQENVGGDIHLIKTQNPYPIDFNELKNQNHDEMNKGFLPCLVENDLDIEKYDTIFIGYPVWATYVLQAVISFLNEYDLSDKTVIPFCTHDGYGAGNSYKTISEVSHAIESFDGLAIEAKDVLSAKETVINWLDSIGMIDNTSKNNETPISITIGDTVLDGVIYDTALAQEIKNKLPLTVSMVGYGGIDFKPENNEGGGLGK